MTGLGPAVHSLPIRLFAPNTSFNSGPGPRITIIRPSFTHGSGPSKPAVPIQVSSHKLQPPNRHTLNLPGGGPGTSVARRRGRWARETVGRSHSRLIHRRAATTCGSPAPPRIHLVPIPSSWLLNPPRAPERNPAPAASRAATLANPWSRSPPALRAPWPPSPRPSGSGPGPPSAPPRVSVRAARRPEPRFEIRLLIRVRWLCSPWIGHFVFWVQGWESRARCRVMGPPTRSASWDWPLLPRLWGMVLLPRLIRLCSSNSGAWIGLSISVPIGVWLCQPETGLERWLVINVTSSIPFLVFLVFLANLVIFIWIFPSFSGPLSFVVVTKFYFPYSLVLKLSFSNYQLLSVSCCLLIKSILNMC
jgi:hypothetical protein